MTDPAVDIDADAPAQPAPRRRGRPPTRNVNAKPKEQVTARALPRGQAVGRNGEVITRSVTTEGDQFHIPDDLKEPGWSYQWLSEKIIGDKDVVRRHNHQMYQAGWRPVVAKGRWNAIFGPKEDTGHIVVSDMGLYERPETLTEEAEVDEKRKAVGLIRDRDQALQGAVKKMLPDGFEANRKAMQYKGRSTSRQMYIDPEANPLAPSYQPADDDVA